MSKKITICPMAMVPKVLKSEYPNETALLVKNKASGKWESISRADFGNAIQETAESLVEFGIEAQETIGVFSENMDKFLVADMAAFSVRAITIPIYATSSVSQVEYMIKDSEMRLIFVGEQLQYNTACKALQNIDHDVKIVIFDESVSLYPDDKSSVYFKDFVNLGNSPINEAKVELRRVEALPTDTAIIMYTSGTSGSSKGVELMHKSLNLVIEAHLKLLTDFKAGNISMNFLPLTHIFEKAWCFICISAGVKIAVNQKPKEILDNLMEVRPHYMCNVPRFWEKVYVGVYEKIQEFPPLLRRITSHCIDVSRHYHFDYRVKGKKAPLGLRIQYAFYSSTLLKLVKKKVGVERGIYFPVAGAALSDKVHAFLVSIGVPLMYGYGLTETTATVSFCRPRDYLFGSIGKPLEGVDVRIVPQNEEQREDGIGEIQVKGPTVMKGYYKKPELNIEAFTQDGWFKTGDLGSMDEDRNLFFKERLKDLFKTANGKYIAPQMIENLITTDPIVEQAVVIAENRSFVSALIYPDWDKVRAYLISKEIDEVPTDIETLAKHKGVYALLEGRIAAQLKDLASYETVKKFVVLSEPLSVENGMLTNSLKTKRQVVEKYYEKEIAQMYDYNQLPNLNDEQKKESSSSTH